MPRRVRTAEADGAPTDTLDLVLEFPMERVENGEVAVGNRPPSWWEESEAGAQPGGPWPSREDHSDLSEADLTRIRWYWRVASIEWLAEHGHLLDWEVEAIRSRAIEAAPRIGTMGEHRGPTTHFFDSNDKTALLLALTIAPDPELESIRLDLQARGEWN